jgi:hypothetical protein
MRLLLLPCMLKRVPSGPLAGIRQCPFVFRSCPKGTQLRVVRALNVTLFNAAVGGFGDAQVTTLVSPEMTALFGDALHAAMLLYKEALLLALPTVLEAEMRQAANDALAAALAGADRSGCVAPPGQPPPHRYDLEEAADVVRLLQRLLGLPSDLATWAPLQRFVNGSAVQEDFHDPRAAERAMLAASPDIMFLDLGADRTSQVGSLSLPWHRRRRRETVGDPVQRGCECTLTALSLSLRSCCSPPATGC